MLPMLATAATRIPVGDQWLHEVKWDGMRVLIEVGPRGVTVTSRTEREVTVAFPELQGIAALTRSRHAVLDGEVVALSGGLPVFGALADRIHVNDARRAERLAASVPVTLMLFDLLAYDGLDLTPLGCVDRRTALHGLGLIGDYSQVPEHFDDGTDLMRVTHAQGLEGVVSKRRDSVYRPGVRSKDWLKLPHRSRGSWVVGGWRPETTGRGRLGAVLVGRPTPAGLEYAGRVGSGLAGKAGARLLALLDPASDCPFSPPPPEVDARGTHWVRPLVVVEVASLGSTPGGRLRQPSYLGVRTEVDIDDPGRLGSG